MSNNQTIQETAGSAAERPDLPRHDAGPLEPKAVLASAHRVWSSAFNDAGMGSLSDASTAQQRLEYLARASLTDAIALVCDGVPAGLTEYAKNVLRGFGDPESAQAVHDFETRIVADRVQAFPVGLEARHGRALAVLRGIDVRSVTARETIDRILSGRGTERDADKLARLLAVEESLPPAMVTAAFEAASQLAEV